MQISKEDESRYLDNPNHCPVCKSRDIVQVGDVVFQEPYTHNSECNSCAATWTDVYTLNAVRYIKKKRYHL